MLRRAAHHVEHALDELVGHVLVKEIRHAIDENAPTGSPAERKLERAGNKPEIEALLERMIRHATETFREGLGVAVLAARRDLRASAYRVPRRVRPLDRASVGHPL